VAVIIKGIFNNYLPTGCCNMLTRWQKSNRSHCSWTSISEKPTFLKNFGQDCRL